MFPNFAQLFGNFPPRPFPLPNPGPSSLPTSSPSSTNNSGVFPLFPPNFGPYYALMQQNQLISQFSKNGNLLNSSTSESSTESRASSADSGNKSWLFLLLWKSVSFIFTELMIFVFAKNFAHFDLHKDVDAFLF